MHNYENHGTVERCWKSVLLPYPKMSARYTSFCLCFGIHQRQWMPYCRDSDKSWRAKQTFFHSSVIFVVVHFPIRNSQQIFLFCFHWSRLICIMVLLVTGKIILKNSKLWKSPHCGKLVKICLATTHKMSVWHANFCCCLNSEAFTVFDVFWNRDKTRCVNRPYLLRCLFFPIQYTREFKSLVM